MNLKKKIILALVLGVLLVSIAYFERTRPARFFGLGNDEISIMADSARKEGKAGRYGPAKEITSPDGFINVEKISIGELVGKKVVLVDFWTYSCINCQRTTPYLNEWYEKYKDQGLQVIGIHTPEFQFEQKYENVLRAVEQLGIRYPVVLDNDYSTWTSYENRYWPRKYLIDIDGFIVYDHIGEGAYEETEAKIQELLKERMAVLGVKGEVSSGVILPQDAEEVDFSLRRSPEIYFGASRNTFLGNGKGGKVGMQTFSPPAGIKTNILYLVGDWDFQSEFAENTNRSAKIIFRYQAKDLYFVGSADREVSVEILRDGKPLGREAGRDIRSEGGTSVLTVKEDQLYKIIEDPAGYGEHTLEMIIEEPGLRAFTFTFG